MLPRRLEPEVMDSVEEAVDYDSMDHSAVNALFVKDFLRLWNGKSPVLDVGTGTAQIPIELCRQDSRPQVHGVDLADEMLKVGRTNVAKAGFVDRIQLDLTDAKRLPYDDESFAAVMSNSIVHHIPEPAPVFAGMVRVCRKGGLLFIRDLKRPEDEDELRRLVDVYAEGANDHQRHMFADSLNAALTLEEVQAIVGKMGFDPKHVMATSDRHWTWAAVR